MILKIAYHEFRYSFISLQSLVIASLFFGLAFLFTANGIEFQSTARGGNVYINSPYMIMNLLVMFGFIAFFIVPSYMASSVLKDVESKFDAILFSTSMSKKGYFFGRFLGAFTCLIVVLFAAPIGMYLGTYWPWAVPETLMVNNINHYMLVFFTFLMPTMFILSAIIYAVAIKSRSMIYSYLCALGILILYITLAISDTISVIWDPFMAEILELQTQYWTAAERNNNFISYSGNVLTNRLIWLSIATAFLVVSYTLFSFRLPAKKVSKNKPLASVSPETNTSIDINFNVSPDWSMTTYFYQLLFQIKFEIMSVIKSVPFLFLMGFSFFMLFFTLTGRETLYDVNTYPLTRILLDAIRSALTLALMAILAFYSAEVIWREKNHKFSEIVDALPAPNWVFVVSKVIALVLLMHVIVFLGIVIAISLQIFSGYSDIQISRYLGRGLIYYTMPYMYLAVLASLLQVLAKNRVLGILFFVIFMALLMLSRDIFGIEHILLSYSLPGIYAPLSDMNMDSRFAVVGYWARVYWGSFSGILLMMIYVFWNRGTLQPMKFRVRKLKSFKLKGFAIPLVVLLSTLIGSGSYIYYNTNVLNVYRNASDIEQLKLAYEKNYRQYQHLPMPRIIDVNINVDIYPYQRRVEARSTQVLQNKTDQNIHTIHVIFPIDIQVPLAEVQGAIKKTINSELNYYIFDLEKPMKPYDKINLKFETVIQQQGFPNSRPDIKLVRNGTFIGNNHLAPVIGFYSALMISDENTRKKYGLEPLSRLPKLEDKSSHSTNYVSHDSDFITFQTTVSTVAEQRAISPGYLMKEWVEGNRRYFTYKMDVPIMNFYSYLSADYSVVRDKWNDVDIEVFHYKSHSYNVKNMISSVKDSLTYFSKAFGSYQYKQLRILEFPAYRNFARAYPNTIPFSEGIGFVVDLSDPKEFNLPYYVTAHEVAHQWWAHQVMSAKTQGGTMLTETLAQYSALMVMEKKYGKHHIRQFLKLELDKYLKGRGNDAKGELPLYKVENQSYIHYRKGAVIMYALKDYIGENVLNRALVRLIKNHAYKSTPYVVSTDFISYLKEEAGVKHHKLIEDFFEKITLYDVKINNAEVIELKNKRFKILLNIEARKFYADSKGNENETDFDLAVDIGLFTNNPADKEFKQSDVIILTKHLILDSNSIIEITVDKRPDFVGIDPYNKLIDRNSDDNITKVTNNNSNLSSNN